MLYKYIRDDVWLAVVLPESSDRGFLSGLFELVTTDHFTLRGTDDLRVILATEEPIYRSDRERLLDELQGIVERMPGVFLVVPTEQVPELPVVLFPRGSSLPVGEDKVKFEATKKQVAAGKPPRMKARYRLRVSLASCAVFHDPSLWFPEQEEKAGKLDLSVLWG